MDEMNRKKTRFIAHHDGFYRLKNTKEWISCYINDISETGISIRTKQSLIIDDQLEICLDEDNKKEVIIATVANVVGQIIGLEFISDDVKLIIDRAVQRAFKKTRSN